MLSWKKWAPVLGKQCHEKLETVKSRRLRDMVRMLCRMRLWLLPRLAGSRSSHHAGRELAVISVIPDVVTEPRDLAVVRAES